MPLRPGPAGNVQRRAVPRRGWTSWTLEMAHSLISTGLLEIISNRHAENAKVPGKPPFPDVQGQFHGDGCRSGGWKWRPARRRVDASSDKASTVDSHPAEPTLPLRIARRTAHPRAGSHERAPCTGKLEDAAVGIGSGRQARRNPSRR
jgi:hypothetical protein